jgi:hypothetical protein
MYPAHLLHDSQAQVCQHRRATLIVELSELVPCSFVVLFWLLRQMCSMESPRGEVVVLQNLQMLKTNFPIAMGIARLHHADDVSDMTLLC